MLELNDSIAIDYLKIYLTNIEKNRKDITIRNEFYIVSPKNDLEYFIDLYYRNYQYSDNFRDIKSQLRECASSIIVNISKLSDGYYKSVIDSLTVVESCLTSNNKDLF